MESNKKIAVVGGTGKAGKYLITQLISCGFQIKALVRDPENFKVNNPLVEIIKGNIADYNIIHELLKDCDAIISTLGLGIPASEKNIFSTAAKNILSAMEEHKMQRYVVITGLNVDTPYDSKSPKTKFATDWMYNNYPLTTKDRQLEYTLLTESDIDWTLVRLPMIEQTDKDSEINVSLEDCPGDVISSTALANFLIGQLFTDNYIKKSPFIANV